MSRSLFRPFPKSLTAASRATKTMKLPWGLVQSRSSIRKMIHQLTFHQAYHTRRLDRMHRFRSGVELTRRFPPPRFRLQTLQQPLPQSLPRQRLGALSRTPTRRLAERRRLHRRRGREARLASGALARRQASGKELSSQLSNGLDYYCIIPRKLADPGASLLERSRPVELPPDHGGSRSLHVCALHARARLLAAGGRCRVREDQERDEESEYARLFRTVRLTGPSLCKIGWGLITLCRYVVYGRKP